MLAKHRMETTQLWRIIRAMPKGAMLHAHLEAMVDMAWLWDQAITVPGICVISPKPLDTEAARATVEWGFTVESEESKYSPASIWSPEYVPNTPVPISLAVKSFPNSTKHPNFRHLFLSHTTITPHESLKQHEGVSAIWAKFEKIFVHINGLVFHPIIFPRFIRQVLRDLIADNVSWADIRIAFLPASFRPCEPDYILTTFASIVEELKLSHPTFWGARIIYTVVRFFDDATLTPLLLDAMELKTRFPDILAGLDFVGHEETRRLDTLVPLILRFQALCRTRNVNLPLFLHAGETLRSDHARNLHDAILLGAKRIGHGFALFRHPLLIEKCKKEGILCEICPISNEVLRLTGSILQHPVSSLLANGVPVAISCDDPGILGQHDGAPGGGWHHHHDHSMSNGNTGAHFTAPARYANGNGVANGLGEEVKEGICADGKPGGGTSHDFWQVLQAFEEVGLEGVGAMAEDSVKWAAFEGDEEVGVVRHGEGVREERVRRWSEMWEEWCGWIVEEFGGALKGEDGEGRSVGAE